MQAPKQLKNEESKAFWKRNAKAMAEDGRLTDHTKDAFILLCQMWATYIDGEANGLDANKVVALAKQVQNLMASFGMTPASRKRLKLDEKKANIEEDQPTTRTASERSRSLWPRSSGNAGNALRPRGLLRALHQSGRCPLRHHCPP